MIGTGTENEGLYYLDNCKPAICHAVQTSSLASWHQRLGHPSHKVLRFLPNFVGSIKPCDASNCLVCPLAKQTRTPFPLSSISTVKPFELLHMDIWGGYHIPSFSGARYFLTIVDDYTRCTWVYLMRHKSDTCTFFMHFIALVETQYMSTVKIIRSDNGPKFNLDSFYSSKGIVHQTSCVVTPQQNRIVKRKHRHLLNVARALLFQAKLPKQFWGKAILTAAYLINSTPTPVLNGKTPYELLFCTPPQYMHLRVFGCLCFASTHAHRPSKFDARATRCIFLGYPHGQKGYKVYDIELGKMFTS
ncbi:hypothetical protein ACFX2A_000471 [Malus domestica]